VVEPLPTRTAEQPAIAVGRPRNGDGRGSNGGRRPPTPSNDGRGRMLLLATIAVIVVALAGVLFKLNSDSEADADDTSDDTVVQSTTTTSTETTTTTTGPSTTTTSTSTTTTTPPVEVPDVSGQPPDDARIILEDAGLTVADAIEEEPSDTVGAGLVIRTDPAAGTSLDQGSPVTLVVSTGPENVPVPDVTGLDEATAIDQIADAGLTAASTTTPVDDPALVGQVLGQTPGGGELVAPGTEVSLTVGEPGEVAAPGSP
jgi:serine/threonine-protein kinase